MKPANEVTSRSSWRTEFGVPTASSSGAGGVVAAATAIELPAPLKVQKPSGGAPEAQGVPGATPDSKSSITCTADGPSSGPPELNANRSKSTWTSEGSPPWTPAITMTISSSAPSNVPSPPVPRSTIELTGALTSRHWSSTSAEVKVVSSRKESS
jgi:hypothetical protein